MSQQLTLELSDEIYTDLQQKADAVGLSITEWIVASLSSQSNIVNQALNSGVQQEEARRRFRNHTGVISLGYPTGLDSEVIDDDLATAYATEYKE
jgi:hypothetical protein